LGDLFCELKYLLYIWGMEQEITYKKCSKCGEEKPLTSEYFYKQKNSLTSRCKLCINEDRKKSYKNKKLETRKKQKEYYYNNKEKIIKKQKEYYYDNRDELLKKQKEYYYDNRDELLKNKIVYFRKNKKRMCEYSNQYQKQRKKKDKIFKLTHNFRNILISSFKKKGWSKKSKTYNYLKCDWKTLKKHIENQFVDGMTWDNHGEWHYDHYYPVSLAQTEEDMYIFNHYTNFQPLWAKDNIIKSNKVPDGFEEWYKMMRKKVL
jgi:hypothetical protein